MEYWSMVAALVALITIPFYVSPFLLGLVFSLMRDLVLRIIYRRSMCDAIRWQDLQTQQFQVTITHPRLTSFSPFHIHRFLRSRRPSYEGFLRFLESAWTIHVQQVERPRYLELKTRYLRIDADVLTVALMMDGATTDPFGFLQSRPPHSFIISNGRVAGNFPRCNADGNDEYFVGTLRRFPNHDVIQPRFQGFSKNDLLVIAHGYPPFYRETFQTHSNVRVRHPVSDRRGASRAGWVVAIGFTSHSPTRMYNTGCSTQYGEACSRVLHTLQTVLSVAFAHHPTFGPTVKAAVEGVAAMNKYKTGSALTKTIHQTVFGSTHSDEIGMNLNVGQINLILNIFNDYSKDKLSAPERAELETTLPEALKAAVNGIYSWWQYVNNEGCAIPEWLLDKRVRLCPIWVKDCDEGADS